MDVPLTGESREFERLVGLLGSDEGYFILALHGFIEGYCKAYLDYTDYSESNFKTVLDDFFYKLKNRGGSTAGAGDLIRNLLWERRMTNQVRHQFCRS